MGRGLITPSRKKIIITETETGASNRDVTVPDGVVTENTNTQLDHRTRQRMTPKPPRKLLSPKSSVKIGQWNVRTMYEVGKCAQVIAEMRRYNISILGISEMRWNTCGRMITATGEMLLYSGKENANDIHEMGVGFILTREASASLMEWEPVSARIVTARFHSRWRNVSIIQCYAPTNTAELEAKEEFYEQLQAVMDKVPKRDIIILMGDMNAKVGRDNRGKERIMGQHGADATMNENGELLTDFCEANEMVIGGSLFPHRDCHKVTWVSPDQRTHNQIDHVIISRRWRSSLQDVRVKRGADVGSDHHLLMAKVKVRMAKLVKAKSGRARYNINRFKERDVRDSFQLKLSNRFQPLFIEDKGQEEVEVNEQRGKEGVEGQWRVIKDAYVKTCEEVLGMKRRERGKCWLSEETWKKIEDRRVLKKKLQEARTRHQRKAASAKYQEACRDVKRLCRRDKRDYTNNLAAEGETAARQGDLKMLYSISKKLSGRLQNKDRPVRNKEGTLLKTIDEELRRWKEHFEEVLNCPDPEDPPDLPSGPDLPIHMGSITKVEIHAAVKKLKRGKAPGLDNIPPEALKEGGAITVDVLHKFLNKIWKEGEIPNEWKVGLLIKLPKKGDLSLCKNWRGIMLLSMVGKILSRVILERLKGALDALLREEQAGFRRGRSCTDQIATLRIIVEQSVEWQSSVYICFVDFAKAFDSVNREVLWKLLRYYGVPEKITNLIRKFYEGFKAQIVHSGLLTESFEMLTGVRQGCLLSPLLFLVVLDWVSKQAFGTSARGIQWHLMKRLEDLEYADDLALLTHRVQDMRSKMEDLIVNGGRVGLRVNADKTKLMKVVTNQAGGVRIGQELLEEVESFQYLGSIINKTGGTDEDIMARIGKARQVFAMLKPVWRTSSLSRKTKLRIFSSNVKSVLLYGAETWRITNNLLNKLQVFVNKCLRSILGIRWPEKIRNEDLWKLTGQEPLELELKRKAWQWIGHTLRRPEGSIAKAALEWNPQGKRRRGRPMQSWRRTRMAELKEKDVSWAATKKVAQNRTRWKAMVSDLCSARK